MDWRRFFSKPPPPDRPPVPVRPLKLTLAAAPAPIAPLFPDPSIPANDALANTLQTRWHAFQRRNANATWSAFTAALKAEIAALDADIAKQRRYLAEHPTDSVYRP